MNRQPEPLSREQKLIEEIKSKDAKYNSLIKSLSFLLKDIEQGKDVKLELQNLIKYKRDYGQKISYEEYLEKEEYSAGFGNWLEKDGVGFLKWDVQSDFYSKNK